MGGVPRRGFSNSWTCCVFFAWKSVIAREFLLKIDTSLAIATSGLRTNLLFEKPPSENPPFNFPDKPGCLQFLRRSALLRSSAPFCALLRTCVNFALFCGRLHSFSHLRVSASDRVYNDCFWELQNLQRILSHTFIRKDFPQRGRNFHNFIRQTIRIRWRIPSQRRLRGFLFEMWWLQFASEFSGHVRIRIRLGSCVAPRRTQVCCAIPPTPPYRTVFFLRRGYPSCLLEDIALQTLSPTMGHYRLSEFIAEIIRKNISLYLYLLWNQKYVQNNFDLLHGPPRSCKEQSCVCICNEKLIPK